MQLGRPADRTGHIAFYYFYGWHVFSLTFLPDANRQVNSRISAPAQPSIFHRDDGEALCGDL